MRICAVVVTYFPERAKVIENYKCYLPWVEHLIIWDNTPQRNINGQFLREIQAESKITYLGTGKNEGISFALNKAIEYATENGYTHLLTMDQDSEWQDFQEYREFANLHQCSIIGPVINDEVIHSSIQRPEYIITSGMIIPVSALHKIGGYWEEFMVDGIDTELCYRAKNSGIEILKSPVGKLIQQYGASKRIRIFGREFNSPQYSPFRLNGITRSCGIIMRKYHTSLSLKKDYFRYTFLFSLFIIIGENDKFRKLSALWRGVWQGLTCNLSKLKQL